MKRSKIGATGYAASMRGRRAGARLRRLAIFAFFDPSGHVAEYVPVLLRALQEHVERIVVVVNGELDAAGEATFAALGLSVHRRANEGFDIWAFRHGLVDVVGWEAVSAFDEVLLLNSTFYGPLFPLSELFGEMETRDTDVWGITGFKGPVPNGFTFQGMLPFHIQSYFMAFRQRVTRSAGFRAWWEQLPPLGGYVDAVLKHETQFTEFLAHQGFRYSLYCDPDRYRVVNPSFDLLDVLIEHRNPFLKRRAFFHDPLYLDLNNVELARAIELIRRTSTYDPRLIWNDIARVSPPTTLYTNANLLLLVPDDGAPLPSVERRRLVTLHLEQLEQLEELLEVIEAIPRPFDLLVLLAHAHLVEGVRAAVASRAAGRVFVRVVQGPAAQAPLTSLVLAGRDVIREGDYELVCALHSVVLDGSAFARQRRSRDHHYDNLVGTAALVTRIEAAFDADPSLGLLLPPEPQIAHSWARDVQTPGALGWHRRLKLVTPLDTFTTPHPPGMFWARPTALRLLLETPFDPAELRDTPDSSVEIDLRRLLIPAVQSTGYVAKRVFTPRHLAANYVKLEFKVQDLVARPPQPAGPAFPRDELTTFLRDRLRDRPVGLKAAETALEAARLAYRAAKAMRQRRAKGSS